VHTYLEDLEVSAFELYLEKIGASLLKCTNEREVLRYSIDVTTNRKNCTVTRKVTNVIYKKATGRITFTGDSRTHYTDFLKDPDKGKLAASGKSKMPEEAVWEEQVRKWHSYLQQASGAKPDQRPMSESAANRFFREAKNQLERARAGQTTISLEDHKRRAQQSLKDQVESKTLKKSGETKAQRKKRLKEEQYGVQTLYDDAFETGENLTRNQKEAVKLLARDGDNCFGCLRPLGRDITREHIISKAVAGGEHLDNKVLMHFECNQALKNMPVGHKLEAILEMRKRAELEEWNNNLTC